ncbi:MAG: iron chaperone [Anaerolineae bacterium]
MKEGSSKPATVDEYIEQFPDDVQEILLQIRAVVKESAPDAVEKISYNMPGFFLNGGLVWFGAYKRHIGWYPGSAGMEALGDELSAYKGTKGSLHFPLDQPIPYDLISRIVKIRVAENLGK